jgi:hypothetical protein
LLFGRGFDGPSEREYVDAVTDRYFILLASWFEDYVAVREASKFLHLLEADMSLDSSVLGYMGILCVV